MSFAENYAAANPIGDACVFGVDIQKAAVLQVRAVDAENKIQSCASGKLCRLGVVAFIASKELQQKYDIRWHECNAV